MSKVKVPLVDCSSMELGWDQSLHYLQVVKDIIQEGRFIGGEEVERFEKTWSGTVGAKDAIAVSSGTDALGLLLRYLRIVYGSSKNKVVVPNTSFVATRDAVHHAGLDPIFCDVDENGLMDPASLIKVLRQNRIYNDVLAIVPVHLYGQVADMRAIEQVAEGFNVRFIVEDACQAHGARYADTNKPVGSRHPAAWSFMPAKILGTWGDAGAVTLPEDSFFERSWFNKARNHGRNSHNEHEFPGFKMRLDTLKAAILRRKILHLRHINRYRAEKAIRYITMLHRYPLRMQPDLKNRVWSYFAVWAVDKETRDKLYTFLKNNGVGVGKHYPYSLSRRNNRQAEELADTTLSLPLWPGMSDRQQEYVVEHVHRFFEEEV